MAQTPEAIGRASGCARTARTLALAAVLTREWLRERAAVGSVVAAPEALIAYLRSQHAYAPDEMMRALFLNARHGMLGDEIFARGTVDQSPIWPRTILRRCLEINAAAVILVHNHPSGEHFPSPQDRTATKRFAETARALDIILHDHLIFSTTGYSSLRSLGLL